MTYRLAVFDIDGTLAGPGGTLSPATIAAVRGLDARGVRVAVATARPYELAMPPLAPLGEAVHAVIAAAGADVRGADGEAIAQTPIPPAAARALGDLCDGRDWRLVAGTAEGAYRRRPAPDARGPAAVVANLAEIALDRVFVVAIFTGEDAAAPAALAALVHAEGLRAERALTSSGREIVAVTHAEAGKGAALRRLCEAYGVALADTAAFGDTEVDLPMLEIAGLGVAMGDAPASLQAAAGLVTGTVREDGVAAAIERIWGEG